MSYEQEYNDECAEDTRETENMRKLFVGGLNRDTSEQMFTDYFSQYGTIVDKVIITDTELKQSRGFGFITFEKSDSVESVFSSRPHEIDGKTVDVKRAMPRELNTQAAHGKTTKLFVGGFKGIQGFETNDLQSYIDSRHGKFGSLTKIEFIKDKESGQNKGFGFIEVDSTDFADRLSISESSFTIKGRPMSIKKSEDRNERGAGGNSGGYGGGMQQRGGGGRGGGRGAGGRGGGRGGGYASQNGGGYGQNNYSNSSYSTSYPTQGGGYGQSQGGYDNRGGGYGGQASYGGEQQQSSYGGGGYGQQSGGYGQQSRGGGGQRYQPY